MHKYRINRSLTFVFKFNSNVIICCLLLEVFCMLKVICNCFLFHNCNSFRSLSFHACPRDFHGLQCRHLEISVRKWPIRLNEGSNLVCQKCLHCLFYPSCASVFNTSSILPVLGRPRRRSHRG